MRQGSHLPAQQGAGEARHFTDEQVRTAIMVLEDEYPGPLERIKQAMQAEPDTEETERLINENLIVMNRVFQRLPFILEAPVPWRAQSDLKQDVFSLVRSELNLVRSKMN